MNYNIKGISYTSLIYFVGKSTYQSDEVPFFTAWKFWVRGNYSTFDNEDMIATN